MTHFIFKQTDSSDGFAFNSICTVKDVHGDWTGSSCLQHKSRRTSPFGVVTAVLRGSISSLMEERKFWEMRRASCSSGKSGWSLGVCFSKS